jgi:NAD(P)-dependent dehydrogenase (short-subunit alcohol dehydrogenase family)
VALSPFSGRVFVVAGSAPVFGAIVDGLMASGALVAAVGTPLTAAEPAAYFRADVTDATAWERVLPHVEQRLGPIDAVVTDEAGSPTALRLTEPDFVRRGHGAVVVVNAGEDADDVLRTLAGTL